MGSYLQQKTASKTQLSTIKLESKAKIKITNEFNALVKYLCNEINTIEWSGVLFFNTEGDLNSSEGLTIIPIDIYPMDKGSTGYTEYDFSEEVFDYYDNYPERFGMKYGHIHSHHNMQSFFSGTDTQELVDNCVNHSYYVSLIVNNKNEMVARLAIAGKREAVSSYTFSFSGILGKIINIKKDNKNEENVMYYVDMEVEKEESINLDRFFVDKVTALKNKPTRSFNLTSFTGGSNVVVNTTPKTYQQKEFDFQFEEKEDDLPANKILAKCLGGNEYQTIQELLEEIMYYEGQPVKLEDIRFYLEQGLDQETVSEYIQEYQRYFYEVPDLETIMNVMKKFKPILNQYASSQYSRIVAIANSVIDKEIAGIRQTLSPL